MFDTHTILVMISGNGTNLQAIIGACEAKLINADICGVISNKKGAYGLVRANNNNIPTFIRSYNKHVHTRLEYDTDLATLVTNLQPNLIVLAGWMHIVSSAFLDAVPCPVINLHPALPDTFIGMHAIQQAWDSFSRGEITHTGVMTHYVIPDVDKGDVIQTLRIPIYKSDTYDSLETRVQKYEKMILTTTIQMLVDEINPFEQNLNNNVYPLVVKGKVRNVYDIGHSLYGIEHTDRLSSFDRHICDIRQKGEILTKTSAFWFQRIEKDLGIQSHYIWSDENVMVVKKCDVLPIEVVVRGYITGSTKTSLWTHYNAGERTYCGITFPDGLQKNQRLTEPVLTPTTKGVEDKPISSEDIVRMKLATQSQWDEIAEKAMAIFTYGQEYASEQGLILVDTKYEFGIDADGNILLIDEVHTCDSSRFWIKHNYEERFMNHQEPDKYDKDVVRDYVKQQYENPYIVESFTIPESHREKTNSVYRDFYHRLTGETICSPIVHSNTNVLSSEYTEQTSYSDTIQQYFKNIHWQTNPTLVLLAGSESDRKHIDILEAFANQYKIHYHSHVASAHKNTACVMELLDFYNSTNGKIIFITIAGRSNALSGVVASNTNYPTIACPPFKDKMDMCVNIQSTLQCPSRVPVMTILEPHNVILAAKKIFEL